MGVSHDVPEPSLDELWFSAVAAQQEALDASVSTELVKAGGILGFMDALVEAVDLIDAADAAKAAYDAALIAEHEAKKEAAHV